MTGEPTCCGPAKLWLVNLLRPDVEWDAATAALAPAERARAARFHFGQDALVWQRGRAAVRALLARELGTAADALVFPTDERGRPSVDGAPAGFDVNWSHSGEWLALAVSRDGRVGVDCEVVREHFPVDEVAPGIFCDEERAWMGAGEKLGRFRRLWTAKEALMKATGLGMALEPAEIRASFDGSGRVSGYASHPGWRAAEVPVPPGLALTVAWRAEAMRNANTFASTRRPPAA